ncbi:2OG-FeII oxygenase superfamily protein [Klosneuvirus KNV1]|uniref:2OG-FeII oxygenase superfamily protein n=1 Tax=Klosneuvirus KNV1 TaxID=1977640 RepID=A0A1V0SJA2_9VIRU|nr:2OG-FeII oxygenase superfamily protein [Klosneuvirus KNV1]
MLQQLYNVQSSPKSKSIASWIDHINVYYYSNFLDQHRADKYYNILEQNLTYNSADDSKVKIFGKEYEISRKQVAYGDTGTTYNFAGISVPAKSWDDQSDIVCKVLKNVKKDVENILMRKFNFCLINRYKDGEDSIGAHFDSELGLCTPIYIAGVSLGAIRDVRFTPVNFVPQKIPNGFNLQLDHGSLFVIGHPTNSYWKHSIPKRADVNTPRISLTFRYIDL